MFKKNAAVMGLTFGLVSSTDGSDIITGTPVVYYTLDGGTQAAVADVAPVHEGNGQWSVDLTSAEMNGDVVGLCFTHASAITVYFAIKTDTKIVSELQDITSAQVNAEVDAALTDYDGPTNAEMIARTLLAASYFDSATDNVTLAAATHTGAVIPTVSTVSNQVTANVTAISGDTLAADNLEATYDGTGYTDDFAPATQSQVGRLSTGSAAISTAATGAVVAVGTETLTYTATANRDTSYHQVADVAGQIDFKYQFDVGGNGVGVSATLHGRLEGANDTLDVFAYNWDGAAWDQIGVFEGANSTTDVEATVNILAAHTGTGANLGKIELRAFQPNGLTTAVVYMDQIYLSYAVVSQSVGYALGRVWVDTVNGIAGTESYVNGTADRPALTFADALTIASNVGISEFNFSPLSTLTLAADLNNTNVYGVGYTTVLAGFDVGGTHFFHTGNMSGTALSATGHMDVVDSIVGNTTVNDSHYTNSTFTGTVTAGAVASTIRVVGGKTVTAAGCTFDFGTSAGIGHDLINHDFNGTIAVSNFGNSGADKMILSGSGEITINASCTAGTIYIYGSWAVTDNGSCIIVYDDTTANVSSILTDTAEIGIAGAGLTDLGGMSTAMKAEVNAEMLDTLITDTFAELAAVPGATSSLKDKITWLFMLARNQIEQTATTTTVRADNTTTAVATSTVSDNGTTATRGELV